jgi:menaquinone-specific isochorismate synthase
VSLKIGHTQLKGMVLGTVVGMALSLLFFILDEMGLTAEQTTLGTGSEHGTGVPAAGLGEQDQAHGQDARATTEADQEHGRDARATGDQTHGQDARATTGAAGLERGTGVSPVCLGSGQARGTGVPPVGFSATRPTVVRRGAYLPHWTSGDAVYAVTFRLCDSLPKEVVREWQAERNRVLSRIGAGDEVSPADREWLREHSKKLDELADAGAGECLLRRPEVAECVVSSLNAFNGVRYELHEWCVMPNHVHVMFRPLGEWSVADIVHSWKSYTAKQANKLCGRRGEFWQAEYYDHVVRDEADYAHTAEYIRRNPEKAGLVNWRWGGHGGGTDPEKAHGQDARATCEQDKAHGRDARATEDQAHGRDARATEQSHGRDGHATVNAALQFHEVGDFRLAVAKALERIARGELRKIVLARAQDVVSPNPFHPLEMLNGLRQRFPDCYAFSHSAGQGVSFIGATPERLVKVSGGMLETEALAGSIRRGVTASEDAALAGALLRSEKDLREQRQVLEDIIARLTPLGLTPEYAAQPQVRKLANVQHLQTPIRARIPNAVRVLDVVAAMHPTPAVGGNPRAVAVPMIRELEGFPRGLYAGAIGWLDAHGGGEFFVGIRSALVEASRARVYAGAGVVSGSTPEKEFAETELKFGAVLGALLT